MLSPVPFRTPPVVLAFQVGLSACNVCFVRVMWRDLFHLFYSSLDIGNCPLCYNLVHYAIWSIMLQLSWLMMLPNLLWYKCLVDLCSQTNFCFPRHFPGCHRSSDRGKCGRARGGRHVCDEGLKLFFFQSFFEVLMWWRTFELRFCSY